MICVDIVVHGVSSVVRCDTYKQLILVLFVGRNSNAQIDNLLVLAFSSNDCVWMTDMERSILLALFTLFFLDRGLGLE
jgi:hypothetical protein